MRNGRLACRSLVMVGLVFLAGAAVFASDSPVMLTPSQIVERMIERAHSHDRDRDYLHYAYTRRAITEALDPQGHVTERQEKLLRFQAGIGAVAEMKVNGRAVPWAELKKEESKLAEKRQELTHSKSNRRDDRWEQFLSSDVIPKYTFTLRGQQVVNGRPAYVLSFRPARDDLPVEKLSDRLMNQLTGTLWIDSQEYEIARAELSLQSAATLWGGVLASLKQFSYKVERVRLPDGAWFNRSTQGEFAGRKLLDAFHVRTRTESSNFHRLAAAAADARRYQSPQSAAN